jgi:hypothetical protein
LASEAVLSYCNDLPNFQEGQPYMKAPRSSIAPSAFAATNPRCSSASGAVAFWRDQVSNLPGFNSRAEGFFVVTLNRERNFTGCHAAPSKSFGDSTRFADEVFSAKFLREAEEAILVHAQPGVSLEASAEDKDRARALILAGRTRDCELLDYVKVGEKDERHPLGVLSFYSRVRGFRAVEPFARPASKAGAANAKAGEDL